MTGITPNRLANLADAMDIGYQGFESGKPDYPICVDGSGDFYFWPHLQWGNKGGCGQLLEWLISKSNILYGKRRNGDYFVSYAPNTEALVDADLKIALVLAALAYVETQDTDV